jgi:hypothetical protein
VKGSLHCSRQALLTVLVGGLKEASISMVGGPRPREPKPVRLRLVREKVSSRRHFGIRWQACASAWG